MSYVNNIKPFITTFLKVLKTILKIANVLIFFVCLIALIRLWGTPIDLFITIGMFGSFLFSPLFDGSSYSTIIVFAIFGLLLMAVALSTCF